MSGLDLFRFELGSVKDDGDIQRVSGAGMPGEEFKEVHRIGIHGLGYSAPKGSHALAVAMHGRRDRAMILGLESAQHRQKNIPAGGAVLYDSAGNVLRMFNDHARWDTQGNPITIKCSTLRFEGDFGVVTFDGSGIKHNGKNIGDTHVHGGIVIGGSDTDVPSN